MPGGTATIDPGAAADLASRLRSGQEEATTLLDTLRGAGVAGIMDSLQGTETSTAFETKLTELVQQLTEALPAFDSLATFVEGFITNFQDADQQQAAALR